MKKNKDTHRSVARTLNLLRFGWFFNFFMMIAPVIVLVYTQKGITVGDFFLIQALFRVSAFLFEIPSGYLSDRFSRRRILILGVIVHMFGYAALAMAYGFWQIVLGEAILGVASALFSGTLEAYTYDLLKRDNAQKNFLKEFGSITTYSQAASFSAAILGGILFPIIGGSAILWTEALLCLITIGLLLFIPELTEVKRKKAKNKSDIADVVGITYNTLKNPKLRNFILFPALFGGFTIILLWILQPVMESAHIPLALFGVYFGINQFSCIVFSKFAYKICAKLGEKTVSLLTIFSIILGAVLTLIVLNTTNMMIIYPACAIMAIVPAIRILNNLQYNTLIHHDIDSKERGTVLSTRAMVGTVFGAVMLSCAKLLLDNFGMEPTMIFTLLMTTLLFWSLNKVKKYLK